MTPARITASRFHGLDGLDDWRFLVESVQATFRAASYPAAVALIVAVADAAEAAGVRPDLDLRPPGTLRVALGVAGVEAVTAAHVELARTVSRLAAEAGAVAEPTAASCVELGIDVLDATAVRPFWVAVLGYDDVEGYLVDPARRGPALWFQEIDAPRPQRNRVHVDLTVPHDVAEQRVAAALAAGGTLLTDGYARSWWVLADAEGNEVCVCTWQDRE